MNDQVNHPAHYNAHPSGVECITVTEHMSFNLGNAVKYIWRAGLKAEDPVTDLRKAAWYVQREIARLEDTAARTSAPPAVPATSEEIRDALERFLALASTTKTEFAVAS
jgi:hypothetical protein